MYYCMLREISHVIICADVCLLASCATREIIEDVLYNEHSASVAARSLS